MASQTPEGFDENFIREVEECPENQLGLYPDFPLPPYGIVKQLFPSSSSDDSEEEDKPEIFSADDSVTLCHISNIAEVIASKSNFNGGRFSKYLEDQYGCLVLPLAAVSKLRKPKGDHKGDPPCIVFIPPKGPDHVQYDNFSEAATTFFNIYHSNEEEDE